MGRYPQKIGVMLILVLSWTVFICVPAKAYVLGGPHVLELMIAKYGKARRMRVTQTWRLPAPVEPAPETEPQEAEVEPQAAESGPGPVEVESQAAKIEPPPVEIELKETVWYHFPESFRSELHTPDGLRIQVVNGSDTLTAVDGRIVQTPADDFDCYKDLLLYRSREELQERLTALGINATLSSLGRFEDRIAFVLGAQYPDESCPQVWVDKDNFRPLRWLFQKRTPAGEPVGLEIQYRNWQLFAGNWYPLQIRFLENGQSVKTLEVQRVAVNPSFSAALFNIQRLKRALLPAVAAVPEPPASEAAGQSR